MADSLPDGKTPRKCALVTGASSGIGAAFARRLARQRYDLVLVARDVGRLETIANELRARHGVEVEVLPADLGVRHELARVEARLAAEPPIDLLVNSAGFGTGGPFATLDPDREEEEVLVNCVAPIRLARAALPGMLVRGHGGIINVSSLAGYQPGPFGATYAASKSFLTTWSEAIHEELRGSGVVVQALCPGFTRTEFQDRAGIDRSRIPTRAWMEADAVVEASLRALRSGRAVCVPGIQYKVVATASRLLPKTAVRRLAGMLNRGPER